MIYLSDDGTIEVSVSDESNPEGRFTVSARQLIEGEIFAFIDVIFGTDNFTRLTYRTQDPAEKVWAASGSHHRDIVTRIAVTIVSKS